MTEKTEFRHIYQVTRRAGQLDFTSHFVCGLWPGRDEVFTPGETPESGVTHIASFTYPVHARIGRRITGGTMARLTMPSTLRHRHFGEIEVSNVVVEADLAGGSKDWERTIGPDFGREYFDQNERLIMDWFERRRE